MYKIEYHNFDFGNSNNQQLAPSAKLIINNIDSGDSYYQIFKKQDPLAALKSLASTADQIKSFSDLIVISMGGATLNPQMLVRFLGKKNTSPKIHFLNNTDPYFFTDILSLVDIKNTALLAISNSGHTLETNALVGCVLEEFQKNNITDISARSYFITNPKNGVLKDISLAIKGTLIPHQEGISGRYSGLSSVSLLIGLIAGIDVEAYITGANSVIDDFYTNQEHSKPALSASDIFSIDKTILVNIGYLQKFDIFLEWYSQIIAESLGKEGKGYTPLRGLGPNDQHSMLQLYLDGPRDKLFSLFYVGDLGLNLLDYKTSNLNELGYLADKNLADINLANFSATLDALISQKIPVRNIILQDVSAKSFGAIVCHFMFEIIFIGHLMNLNPFNQPGVELIKTRSSALVSK